MATFTPAWTPGATLHTSSDLTVGSPTAQDDFNLASLGYYAIRAQIEINAVTGAPSGDVKIEVFSSSDGGTTVDTEPFQTFVLIFTTTGNKKRSFDIWGPWSRVKVTNSVGQTVTYIGKYAGLKQASA